MGGRAALLLALSAAVCEPAAKAETTPSWRQEVVSGLDQVACKDEAQAGLPWVLWARGLFDAQIEGEIVARADRGKLKDVDLRRQALRNARAAHYFGAAASLCGETMGWVLVLPAAEPLVYDLQRVKLPSSLFEKCATVRVDFAPAAGGKPQALKRDGHNVDLKGLGNGTATVTCQPDTPRWLGPQVWYMLPVGEGPLRQTPYFKPSHDLATWINAVRAAQNLRPLATSHAALADAALDLHESGRIAHDRRDLRRAHNGLARKDFQLIGEDRVRARSIADLTWLLWNSPSHRGLLLDAEATHAGIALQKDGEQFFAVIVTARRI